jgi:hypothetical protein
MGYVGDIESGISLHLAPEATRLILAVKELLPPPAAISPPHHAAITLGVVDQAISLTKIG